MSCTGILRILKRRAALSSGKITGFFGEPGAAYHGCGSDAHRGLQTNPHLLRWGAQRNVVILVEPFFFGIVVNELKAMIHIVMPAPNVES